MEVSSKYRLKEKSISLRHIKQTAPNGMANVCMSLTHSFTLR